MAKIVIESDFELEVGDRKFLGVLRDFTKAEEKIYRKKLKKLKGKKDRVEQTFKTALDMRVDSDEKDAVLQLGEDYGYELVYKTILFDIIESTKKKDSD